MIYIVDKFGGNSIAIERAVRETDEAKRGADDLYFTGDYQSALEAYDAVIALVSERVDEAREIARRALFYVCLIEWATVTATFMISGVVVYSLMIRRRMYAEVETTRLKKHADA